MFNSKSLFILASILAITEAKSETSGKKFTEELSEVGSKYWLLSCTLSGCSFAFSSCMNCFGERGCKSCITISKPECAVCAEDIYNKDDLETINGNNYLICDSLDPIQSKVCHLYCRGQYAQSGQCVRENNIPICRCSSESGPFTNNSTVTTQTTQTTYPTTTSQSTLKPNTPTIYFNGTAKLKISISNSYRRILPLSNGDLVRGSGGNLIEIWDLQKGVIRRNLSSAYFNPLVFGLLSNGDLVAGYSYNKTFLVWDLNVKNGQQLKSIIQTNETIYSLTVLKNDDLAIGQNSNGYSIIIRNSQNGLIKKKLVGHFDIVYQIIELPNGNLVSCSADKTVKVWNISNGAVAKSFCHPAYVYSISFLQNGYLVSGLSDGTINIWNMETNHLIKSLIGHSTSVCHNNCLHAFSNGDLLSGSFDKTIKVWNTFNETVKFTSPSHKSRVYQLAVLASGNFISSSDNELIIWN